MIVDRTTRCFLGYKVVWERTQAVIQERVEEVEGDNAELRHYLARLAHRSRCFSRCPEALKAALKLFLYCFNRRQLRKQLIPNYTAHVFQFV